MNGLNLKLKSLIHSFGNQNIFFIFHEKEQFITQRKYMNHVNFII